MIVDFVTKGEIYKCSPLLPHYNHYRIIVYNGRFRDCRLFGDFLMAMSKVLQLSHVQTFEVGRSILPNTVVPRPKVKLNDHLEMTSQNYLFWEKINGQD